MNKFDTIIIGSGVSGMSAGIILAKNGRKVLILEQGKKAGGLMQIFRRGSSLFPTGLHRLGCLGNREILQAYFQYLDVYDRLDLIPMDDQGFEQICFPGIDFKAPMGYDAYSQSLKDLFPHEKKAVDDYLEVMQKTVAGFRLYNLNHNTFPALDDDLPPLSESIESFLLKIGCSQKLLSILTGNNPLYGLEPWECPSLIHFFVTDSFLKSSWRVNEYKTPFAGAFIDAFAHAGGSIRCNARVESVSCTEGRVKGVVLNTREYIPCSEVLFTGHPAGLVDICQAGGMLRPAYKNRIMRAENTCGVFGVALEWHDSECPFALCDTYLYSSEYEPLEYGADKKETSLPPLFSSSGTDTTWYPRMIYCSALPAANEDIFSVTALIHVSTDEANRFIDLKKNDNQTYQQKKMETARGIVKQMNLKWKGMNEKVKIAAVYTPASFAEYTLSPSGSSYGIKKTVKNFWKNHFNPVTKISGLYLAGQSLMISGITGSVISSVQACMAMPGMESLYENIMEEVL